MSMKCKALADIGRRAAEMELLATERAAKLRSKRCTLLLGTFVVLNSVVLILMIIKLTRY